MAGYCYKRADTYRTRITQTRVLKDLAANIGNDRMVLSSKIFLKRPVVGSRPVPGKRFPELPVD